MTRILIVKMSALGDILHTLPAVTDALKHDPSLQTDWLCEEPFADIARLHPGLHQVIPHGRLRWKKRRLAFATLKEQWQFYCGLRRNQYDLVIDAQGRIKSARVGWLSGAPVFGADEQSATDAETRHVYRQGYPITEVNAIERTRELFGKVLGYQPSGQPDFGINTERLAACPPEWQGQLIFFHGTTWDSKHWPESQWCELLELARRAGQKVLLPWGNDVEKQRAERLVEAVGWGEVLPKMSLWNLSGVIAHCRGAVGVDTGLMHVAAGMGIPTVAIFGSTSVALTGAMGRQVVNLQTDYECSPCRQKVCPKLENGVPPCYTTMSATKVWSELLILAEKRV
ncbi:lipopolysaccharide heptosyltransferase I [Oceanobacter antarcticus]|uniref:Lipopolysaccharide heptosyltransferase 1 n=1 Tax=Oceanobacter antarcticus TaxID=3133425 RepID=A0ABW8NFW9_9GAMM